MIKVQPRLRKKMEGKNRSQNYKQTLRTEWGNMKKSGSGAHGSKDENQKTMIISNFWLIN